MEFSPFLETRLACATAQNFGIVGNGRQYVLDVDPEEQLIECAYSFDTNDGLYDCAWSEENENHLVSVSGDGSVKVWDLEALDNPLRSLHEHENEAYSVDWNLQGAYSIRSSPSTLPRRTFDLVSGHGLAHLQTHATHSWSHSTTMLLHISHTRAHAA